MDKKFVNGKLTSIEEEIRVLKSQLAGNIRSQRKKFSSLEGIWRNKVNLSFEEIEKAKIKPKGEL